MCELEVDSIASSDRALPLDAIVEANHNDARLATCKL